MGARFRPTGELRCPEDVGEPQSLRRVDIAVLLPCYNEELSVGQVVRDFKAHLPHARIYVYNNNSTDRTLQVAREAGAITRDEPIQGKGNVVRRMFADVEADVYVLVDGDGTYDAACAGAAVQELVSRALDVVNIARAPSSDAVYRPGHHFGNALISGVVAAIFGDRFADALSGYKVFSRRFVKSFPPFARGFEIETELTIHALDLRMPVAEREAPYRERPAGSASKLRTVRDGGRILMAILALIREERPLQFFSLFAFLFAAVSLVLAWPLVTQYMVTGLVPRVPTAVLCSGLMILAFLSATCGLILDTVTRGRKELKWLRYLSLPAPSATLDILDGTIGDAKSTRTLRGRSGSSASIAPRSPPARP
jgi:Glycosyl transferase family 2